LKARFWNRSPPTPSSPPRRNMLKVGFLMAMVTLTVLGSAALTRASAPTNGGMGVPTTGYLTTYFLEPITYENADYYYDLDNQLQYSSYIFHHGVDISGGCYAGQYPIYAATDGIVALAQYINDGYGTQVVVDNGFDVGGNGRYTYSFYSHMGNRSTGDRYIAVSPGQFVRAGQLLGYQGNDGTSFGSCQPNPGTHLDWEIRVSNVPISYGIYMRYSAIAASHNYYVNQQLTYGLPNPVPHVTAGPFEPGGNPTNTPGPAPTWTPGPCGMSFSDLPDTHWAYTYISYLYCRSVVAGFPDGTFRPDDYPSRGLFTKWITLGLGWNLYNPYFPTFTDVASGSDFYQYVETAHLRGIINGYTDGTFRPDNPVTRAQAAKMLSLAKGWQIANPPNPTFSDVPSSHWAYAYIETAVSRGIVGGYADGTYRPDALLTRAQLAKILALTMQQAKPNP
jgi:murein DD-endopeptidase MepM/ murein hydrolase activator NlpD